jgi:hypothetical protein
MNDRQRLEAIVAVVCKYLPPDGISREDAMREIIGLVDPLPEQQSISTNDHLCAMLRQVHDVLACTALPMKREWVGLTSDDMPAIRDGDHAFWAGAQFADAWLKEKNND